MLNTARLRSSGQATNTLIASWMNTREISSDISVASKRKWRGGEKKERDNNRSRQNLFWLYHPRLHEQHTSTFVWGGRTNVSFFMAASAETGTAAHRRPHCATKQKHSSWKNRCSLQNVRIFVLYTINKPFVHNWGKNTTVSLPTSTWVDHSRQCMSHQSTADRKCRIFWDDHFQLVR